MEGDNDDRGNESDDDAPLLSFQRSSFKDRRKKLNLGAASWLFTGPDQYPGGGGRNCGTAGVLPPRILLLALYLMFTLSTFWILDSIKEPTLALLVHNNELGKHQPRAKMVSFLVVVFLALVMEAIMRGGRRRRQRRRANQRRGGQPQTRPRSRQWEANAALEKSWEERNLPSSMRDVSSSSVDGGRWKKMGTQTSQNFWHRWNRLRDWTRKRSGGAGGGNGNYRDFDYVNDESEEEDRDAHDEGIGASAFTSSRLSPTAFYVVGVVYIKAFLAVAIALRHHPSFRSSSMVNRHVGSLDPNDVGSSSSSWYYTALGYVFFALVESYGSVSITLFWSFANSHLTLEAAEKHYGSTVALAQAGAIGGSTLVAVLGRGKTNGTYGGPAVGVTADALVGIAAHEVVGVGGVVGTGNDVTPVLIFLACGCIAAGLAVMLLYGRLFAAPMMDRRLPLATKTSMTTAHCEGAHDVRADCSEMYDDSMKGMGIIKDCDHRNRSRHSTIDGGGTITTDASHENNGTFNDLFGGVYMIYRHHYLQLVLAVSVLYEIALTCMHYEMNLLGLDRFGVGGAGASVVKVDHVIDSGSAYDVVDMEGSPENRSDRGITYIQFMGWYGQTVNVLSLILSFYAFPRLIKNYGLRTTIRIFPTVLLLVTIFAFVLFPRNLYFLFVSLSVCKALTYSVHDPAEEVLYMPTSDDAKFRAKFWIDVVGQRIAKAIGSAINNYAGSVEEIVKYGSLPSIVSSMALWLVCYQVGIQFDRLIKNGEVVGSEEENRRFELEQSELEQFGGILDIDAEDGTKKIDCDEGIDTVEHDEK